MEVEGFLFVLFLPTRPPRGAWVFRWTFSPSFLCKKTFVSLSKLKQNNIVHTGEKQHLCEECDQTFSHSGSLKSHMMIHSGVKLYICKECDQTFSHSSSLKSHKMIHTGGRNLRYAWNVTKHFLHLAA